jgi:hypothetical protein
VGEPTPRGALTQEALNGFFLLDRAHLEAMPPQRQRPPEIRYVSALLRPAKIETMPFLSTSIPTNTG